MIIYIYIYYEYDIQVTAEKARTTSCVMFYGLLNMDMLVLDNQ